ncbi:c-type cytochrome biogenesis protein CcmI [Thioclava sp. BHET1]|nr:c-type cytochrome biogenesis protein CcmI [Thioclava sp. BHET1]
MDFWIPALGLMVVIGFLMIFALRRGGRNLAPAQDYDLQVYRDQLREVERERGRGVIPEQEAERLRTEVARRILETQRSKAQGETGGPGWLANTLAIALICCLGLAAVVLYLGLGAVGDPDQPIKLRLSEAAQARADRISQSAAEAKMPPFKPAASIDKTFLDLVEKLRAAVKARPDDLRGEQLLARNEAQIGNYSAAWRAQAKVIALLGDKVTAQDYATQAALMILATDGYVSPDADQPLEAALHLDPNNGAAGYYTGLMFAQTGRPDLAFRIWQPLLARSKADDPWVAPIRNQIDDVAALAGIRYELPPQAKSADALPGPDQSDIASAQKLSPADRQEMIRGMVESLASRLDASGGSAAEWARLIRAYGVLNEPAKQQVALAKAKAAYAGKPDDLAVIEAATGSNASAAADATAQDGASSAGAIAAMVEKLSQKLVSEGGRPAEWAQLISAYGVLGESDRARDIWHKAQEAFGKDTGALAPVRAAAEKVGVAQ